MAYRDLFYGSTMNLSLNDVKTNTLTLNGETGALVTENNQTIKGVKTFNSSPICSAIPTASNQLVNKGYIDQMVSYNLIWQLPVISFYNFVIPITNPNDGDRYVCNATVPGQFTINHVVTWSSSSQTWIDVTPIEGFCLHVDADSGQFANQNVIFNGTTWINIGSVTTYADLIGKPNQDLNTNSNVSFNSVTTNLITGPTTGMNITPSLRSNNIFENIITLDGAQTISGVSGTYIFTGTGTVTLYLIDPTLTSVNGTTATIISHKQGGSLINVLSANSYAYITGLPMGATAHCQMTDRTSDALHCWYNPYITGGAPYYATVHTNNSSGVNLGSIFIMQKIEDYTVKLTFTFATVDTVFTSVTNMCVGPLQIPTLSGAFPQIGFCEITTNSLGRVPATMTLGDSDLTYIYIKPVNGSYPSSDSKFGIYTTTFTYIWRPNEY